MNEKHIVKIATELVIPAKSVIGVAVLLGEGSTVPFIARYRKEATGSLDEVAISNIRDRLKELGELDARREAILKSLTERELLTDELQKSIDAAETLSSLEDIYLPFRPKRRTRAMIAKEKGLEPLALWLLEQTAGKDPTEEALKFVDAEKGVANAEEALAGASDIIAETVNEDKDVRAKLRELFIKESAVSSKVIKGKESESSKFKDYFDWSEPIGKIAGHRVLAMFRGEKEEELRLAVRPDEKMALSIICSQYLKGSSKSAEVVKSAIEDCYTRLLSWSMEVETRLFLKQNADATAIKVFSDNLRELLMSPALGGKRVLAIDPGFRTGCKVVALSEQGKLLYNSVIYPTQSDYQKDESKKMVMALCDRFKVEAIAIGNGTASRETESFVRSLGLPKEIIIVSVNESGASIYSASEIAREEFPDQDITVRGSVSIGRRLMDPLSELVKLDPKSIGVGQYQHDVDQSKLKDSLDDVVISCVNAVGVEVNTASKSLLSYVSGIGPVLAKNIVAYRDENGGFKSRTDLKKVPKLGPKAFEQSAGFLRVRDSKNPLDRSAVHPESYEIVKKMADDLACSVEELMKDQTLQGKIEPKKYVTEKIGLPTLVDIVAELKKPGRDPRANFEQYSFSEEVHELKDLKKGQILPGIVTNVTNFGAFIDIGVHQDGLAHISEMSEKYIKDPMEVAKVNQKVMVRVIDVDIDRKRIALSLRLEDKPRVDTGSKPSTGPRPQMNVASKSPFAVLAAIRASLK